MSCNICGREMLTGGCSNSDCPTKIRTYRINTIEETATAKEDAELRAEVERLEAWIKEWSPMGAAAATRRAETAEARVRELEDDQAGMDSLIAMANATNDKIVARVRELEGQLSAVKKLVQIGDANKLISVLQRYSPSLSEMAADTTRNEASDE